MFYNMFYNMFHKLEVGEYMFDELDFSLDPFSEYEGTLIEIVDIKGGYVKYKYRTNHSFYGNIYSMKKPELLFLYTRVNSLDFKRKEKILNSKYFDKEGVIKCSDS